MKISGRNEDDSVIVTETQCEQRDVDPFQDRILGAHKQNSAMESHEVGTADKSESSLLRQEKSSKPRIAWIADAAEEDTPAFAEAQLVFTRVAKIFGGLAIKQAGKPIVADWFLRQNILEPGVGK
jgi:hypothetical protein